MRSNSVKRIVFSALIAAIYAVLTSVLAPISYGPVQFRISEIMVLFAFIDPFYIVGLTLGCFIANLSSPNGILDLCVGTLATFLSVSAISFTRKYLKDKMSSLIIASLWPTIINGLMIGYMLNYVANLPLFLTIGQVALGEFVVITLVGVPAFRILTKKMKSTLVDRI